MPEWGARLENSSLFCCMQLSLFCDSPVMSIAPVLDSGQHQLIQGGAINLHIRVNCAIVYLWNTELVFFCLNMELIACCGGEGLGACVILHWLKFLQMLFLSQ